MRIGVLNNVRAGRNPRRVARVRTFLKAHPEIPHVETESGEHVGEALSLLAQKEVDLLAIHGGDGTLQRTLTEILSDGHFAQPPLIAPLRGGRTNMNALDLGSRRNPVTASVSLRQMAPAQAGITRTAQGGRLLQGPVDIFLTVGTP